MGSTNDADRVRSTAELRPGDDPTRMSNQPALTRSSGRIWLVVHGIATVVFVAVLAALLPISTAITVVTIVLDLVLYLGAIVARIALRPGPRRLRTMAGMFIAAAAITLLGVSLLPYAAAAG